MWELSFLGKMMTLFVIDNGKYELIIWFTFILGWCFQVLLQHFFMNWECSSSTCYA